MGADSKSRKESKHALFVGGFFGASAKDLEKAFFFFFFFFFLFSRSDHFPSSLARLATSRWLI
jgi:hypothetical protein